MLKKILAVSVCMVAILIGLSEAPAYAERVRHVIDGDTVVMQDNQRVRLIGVDAPEIENRKYGRKGEYFGKDAKYFLNELVRGKQVRLERDQEEFDRYGRLLAYLYLEDGTLVNKKLIEQGYAEAYQKFPYRYKQDFKLAEQAARQGKKGLWADKKPAAWERVHQWWQAQGNK